MISDIIALGGFLFTVLMGYWSISPRATGKRRTIRLFAACVCGLVFITAAAKSAVNRLPQKKEAVTFSDERRGRQKDGLYHTEVTVHCNCKHPTNGLTIYIVGKHLDWHLPILVNRVVQGLVITNSFSEGASFSFSSGPDLDDNQEHYIPFMFAAQKGDYRLDIATRMESKIKFRGEPN